MPLFVKWAQYAPWRGMPFPAHFQENRPLKTPESLKIWAFPVMVLFLSLLFSKVSTMPYGDCSLSKKLDDGGHKTAELGYPDNIHGCCQSACPSILPAENQERVMRELPQSRRHALTMTKREAETCQSFLDVFLPYRPNGCRDSMANPNYLLLPSRRFGGHGALARENGKRREKTVQALYRLFVFPRRSIGCHSIFAS